ncbi:TatD DNase family protein [Trueperella bonasi]|uniref:TatD DNase family protein n=1 Tax=Trueperella bonasi TaxID=312286 RepID=A0ABT9NGL7_9ACTO|nr:TatD family hydrolase [Trueperella bonasi]MDP9806143.1 TatD DNase family protein [Trueperella bonasi]
MAGEQPGAKVQPGSKRDRKRAFPEIPEALDVPIVDNHTHFYPDPVPEVGEPLVQNTNLEGRWKPPLLLANHLAGMEAAGVRAAISSGCDLPLLEWTRDLAISNPNLWAALAIHPNEAPLHAGVREVGPDGNEPRVAPHHEQYSLDEAIGEVARLSSSEAVVAVGETGLDYFRTGEEGRAAQKRSFREHIALAKELDKPLQIHDREAHADVVDILLADGAPERTVFHCFSGDADLARILAENGWYASFAGNVTYPANKDLRNGAEHIPAELMLVETDAPYLTPEPYRGQPNAVWAVVYTAKFLAELRGFGLDEFCARIDRTTRDVYGI